MNTEMQLIDICKDLGAIATSNGNFTHGLALKIEATGKNIQDMTVCELLHLANDYKEVFNKYHD